MKGEVEILNGAQLPQEEIDAYIARGKEKYGREPVKLIIGVDGEYVDLEYRFARVPFERIRRITGYLVGTLDRFNDAKRAEEGERVRHGL